MNDINLHDWLLHEVGTGTDPMDFPLGAPTSQPGGVPAASPYGDPNAAGMPPPQGGQSPQQQPPAGNTDPSTAGQMPDVSADPQYPDMPEEDDGEDVDFEKWKKRFLEESVKGDVEKMKDLILKVRDRKLDAYHRKFVEDNLQILFLRENSNVDKAGKEIRKLVREQLDHNNPGTSLATHVTAVLENQPALGNVFIKMTGLRGMKGDAHRGYVAALLGAVQVGSGGASEDLVLTDHDYSVRISTRCTARFGNVPVGEWVLREDDPSRFLAAPELRRLEDGSPEEKDVLRRRVVMESIATAYKTRAFFVNVVDPDGTVYTLGWDLATCLKSAYTEGKLVVRTDDDDSSEAMIDDDGAIVPFQDMKILYRMPTDEQDDQGQPVLRDAEFLHNRYGQLYLTATANVLKHAASNLQGLVLKETPYRGNPSDLLTIARCVPSLPEILLRSC